MLKKTEFSTEAFRRLQNKKVWNNWFNLFHCFLNNVLKSQCVKSLLLLSNKCREVKSTNMFICNSG